MNVGNNSCIDKVNECIVYKSTINRARMEDSEVGVFDTWGVEVGVRVGASM
jgi:hypothetical protein